MINKVILIGNVGQDPEIRYVGDPSSTTKVATIRLATSERYKDRSGVLQEHTEWHSVVAWRGTADVVEKYVKKGTQIYVEGRLRTRSWDDQGGNKRYSTEILADTLQLLGRRSDNPGSGAYQQSAGSGASQLPHRMVSRRLSISSHRLHILSRQDSSQLLPLLFRMNRRMIFHSN